MFACWLMIPVYVRVLANNPCLCRALGTQCALRLFVLCRARLSCTTTSWRNFSWPSPPRSPPKPSTRYETTKRIFLFLFFSFIFCSTPPPHAHAHAGNKPIFVLFLFISCLETCISTFTASSPLTSNVFEIFTDVFFFFPLLSREMKT